MWPTYARLAPSFGGSPLRGDADGEIADEVERGWFGHAALWQFLGGLTRGWVGMYTGVGICQYIFFLAGAFPETS
ncbi:MAG: hypothetical protein EBQ80_01870 [Proteobacteria bacterium]|nr:hypothetical protein [Pseudomonadota bacterium]